MKKKAERPKKTKTNIFKNFCYGFKKVYQIDKSYVICRFIYLFASTANAYLYALVLKNAIAVLEQPDPTFAKILINTIPISIIIVTLSVLSRTSNEALNVKDDKLYYSLSKEKELASLDKDYEQLERQDVQEVSERAGRYIGSWQGIFGVFNRGFFLIGNFLRFVIGCIIILTVNLWLIFVLVGLAIIKLVIESRRQKMEKNRNDKRIPMWRRISYINNISTNLSIGKDLRIYNMDRFVEEERNDATKSMLKIWRESGRLSFLYFSSSSLISIIDSLCLYGVMINEVLNNNMEISMFSYMISAVFQVINALSSFMSEIGYAYRSSLEADDFTNFMSDAYTRSGQTATVTRENFEIEFKNVYYSYFSQEGYALENVSFKIKKGEKVALVGYNGAGKTTLTKLICGLYHPTKGQILINGVDIETISRESLADVISPVFQEAIVYSYTIEQNIAMSYQEDIDSDKVKKALELVELKEKVDSLEKKEKTILTRDFEEEGIEFSGGESQKLTIARALYKNAPLYILDEPTSAMDAISESHLYQNFNKIIEDNAVIFISHRLSSTKFCDRIIVIDGGKIIEEGTHQSLMKQKDSLYCKLFTMQAEYYVGGGQNEKA